MKLTNEIIEHLASRNGGWKRHVLKMLGVDCSEWPPVTGWKRDVIGKDYPREYLKLIWHMRNLTPKQYQKVCKGLFDYYKSHDLNT